MALALLLIKWAIGGVMGGLLASMGFGIGTWQFWACLFLLAAYGIADSIK